MTFVPTLDGVRICMRFSQEGQQVCNVYHVIDEDAATPARLMAIAEVFKDWWDTNVRPATSNTVSLQAVEAKDISAEFGVAVENTTGLPLAGAVVGQLPNSVTLAVKHITGFMGRSFRGRTYHIGLAPASLEPTDANFVTPAVQAQISGFYNTLRTELFTFGVNLAVLSLVEGGNPRLAGLLTPIISSAANRAIDNQRRRLPERGS